MVSPFLTLGFVTRHGSFRRESTRERVRICLVALVCQVHVWQGFVGHHCGDLGKSIDSNEDARIAVCEKSLVAKGNSHTTTEQG
jgi:hypothetical protein